MRGRCLSGVEGTLFLALVGVGGADDGSLTVYDDDALHVLVSLHAVQCLLDLRHDDASYIISITGEMVIGKKEKKKEGG